MSNVTHNLTINNVRFSYVKVFGPGEERENGGRSWSASLLIPKDHPQLEEIRATIKKVVTDNPDVLSGGGIKSCLLNGDAKDEETGEYKYTDATVRGHFFIRAANYNRRPSVVDANVEPILDPEQFFSGCFGNAHINFYPYDQKVNKGVSAGLEAIQMTRKGERLGAGAVDPKAIFKPAKSAASNADEDFLG